MRTKQATSRQYLKAITAKAPIKRMISQSQHTDLRLSHMARHTIKRCHNLFLSMASSQITLLKLRHMTNRRT